MWTFFAQLLWSTVWSQFLISHVHGHIKVGEKLPVANNPHVYHEIYNSKGHMNLKTCPFVFSEQMVFDGHQQKCVIGLIRRKRQTSIAARCTQNTECYGEGQYCEDLKSCQCLTNFVEVNAQCLRKSNPGSYCTNTAQCTAVTANAYCDSTSVCRCNSNRDPIQTNTGFICIAPGACPTNGEAPKYVDNSANGAPLFCNSIIDCPKGYECISDGSTSAGASINSAYCCPGVGFTCIEYYDQGSGTQSTLRYWYNAQAGNCESFYYKGNGGNANNFLTQAQCESYCSTYCTRGDPEGSVPTSVAAPNAGNTGILNLYSNPISCTADSSCSSTAYYFCSTQGTNQYCCPRESYVCAQRGGLDYSDTLAPFGKAVTAHTSNGPTSYYDPGIQNPNRPRTYTRYYFDTNDNQCKPFTYNGQAGNLNRFYNQEHCEIYCSAVLCTAGEPLKDSTQTTVIACGGSTSCPSSYTCTSSSVCCMTAQTVCGLQPAFGSGAQRVTKWYYNARQGSCQQFTFSGSGGNANQFTNQIDCQTFCSDQNVIPTCPQGEALKDSSGTYLICGGTRGTITSCSANYYCFYDGFAYGCCPTRVTTCSATFDTGTTCEGPRVNRWYFDSSGRRCNTFQYYGCDGNSNNFATKFDCEEYCGVGGCPEGGEPSRDTNGNFRPCSGGQGCPTNYYCTAVIFGTSSITSTLNGQYCCPSKSQVCSFSRDEGTTCSASPIARYYFNPSSRNCESFTYGGCSGNRNNFPTAQRCLSYCNSAGCPAGTVSLRAADGVTLAGCSAGTATTGTGTCPTGYTCVFSALLQQGICCGVPDASGICPNSLIPYYDAQTNTALQCVPNAVGSCPSGYRCIYNRVNNVYYCCGTGGVICPQGGTVLINSATSNARQCVPGLADACPSSYTCQATTVTVGGVPSTTGYCCGQGGICDNGGSPDLINTSPVTCTIQSNTCRTGFNCRLSVINNQYYCCSPPTAASSPVCGTTGSPYLVNTLPVVCNQGSTSTNCPPPFRCILYPSTNNFYCCGTGNVTVSQVCPPNFTPELASATTLNRVGNQYVGCSPNSNVQGTGTCTAGSFCLSSPSLGTATQFICCRSNNQIVQTANCPSGVTTQAVCTNGGCPFGQLCLSLNSGQFCCPTSLQCRAGQPLTTGQGGTTRTCGSGNNCPNGYTCTNNACCPDQSNVCSQPASTGFACPGGSPTTLYYSQNGVCNSFSYQGCGGNSNAFQSTTDCQTFCGASTPSQPCPSGLLPEIASNGQVTECTTNQNVCTQSRLCYPSINGRSYCCGPLPTPQPIGDGRGCPSGNSFIYQNTQPLACRPGGSPCPTGFVCLKSTLSSGYQCCSTAGATQTPSVRPATTLRLAPGDTGCDSDTQCQSSGEPYARCTSGQCLCSVNLLVYQRRCVTSCTWPYYNANGICTTANKKRKECTGEHCSESNTSG